MTAPPTVQSVEERVNLLRDIGSIKHLNPWGDQVTDEQNKAHLEKRNE